MTTIPTITSATSTQVTAISPASPAAKVVIAITILGALNWGLIGFFHFNLVEAIFGCDASGHPSTATCIVYMIIGIAGLVSAIMLPKVQLVAAQSTTIRRIS